MSPTRKTFTCLPACLIVCLIPMTFINCATEVLVADKEGTSVVPPYAWAPQPLGSSLSDLAPVMAHKDFPGADRLKDCDRDFKMLNEMAKSEPERAQGIRELVDRDPLAYHWCFYYKAWEVEKFANSNAYWDEKQKSVIETYGFMTPIARAFKTGYQDSRYLRWALAQYQRLSFVVFDSKLSPKPTVASELVDISSPFGLWKEPIPERTQEVVKKHDAPGEGEFPAPEERNRK